MPGTDIDLLAIGEILIDFISTERGRQPAGGDSFSPAAGRLTCQPGCERIPPGKTSRLAGQDGCGARSASS